MVGYQAEVRRSPSLPGLLLAFTLLAQGARALSDDPEWNYMNQDNWGGVCRSGEAQSPIDISTSDVIHRSAEPITFINYEKSGMADFKVSGKSLSMKVQNTCSYGITAGGLWGHYILHHIHLHLLSEHEIDNEQSQLEAHLVHYNAKYESLEEAMNHPRGLAVIGVMFHGSNEGSPVVHFLKSGFESTGSQNGPNRLYLTPIRLLPLDRNHFYRYEGSLTTPPCSEVVVWTVMRDTIPINNTQLEDLRMFLQKSDTGPRKHNFRDTQDLNDRPVYLYSTEYGSYSTSARIFPEIMLLCCSILAVFMRY